MSETILGTTVRGYDGSKVQEIRYKIFYFEIM